jgi:DNA-binding NtrC family response regulator
VDTSACKVLVIDDEKIIADSLRLIFLTNGYEALSAYSAEEATEIIAEWLPDLIIVDVILPGMNGIELAVAVNEQFPNCRVLLFSGQTTTADLLDDAATRGHSFEILSKPIHPDEMLAAAQRLLGAGEPN